MKKMTLKERFIRFMSGRNGTDRFGQALLYFYLALFILNIFLKSWFVSLAIDILIVYTLFRMFSKNLYKRQKENAWYCSLENKVRSYFKLRKRIWNDRHTHVYRKCPGCKKMVRLPKIKGKHVAVCPSCKTNFNVNV